MTLKFHNILARRTRRRIETKDQRFVQQLSRGWMAKLSNGSRSSVWQRAGDLSAGGMRARPADSDYGNRRRRTTARNCEDGVRRHAA